MTQQICSTTATRVRSSVSTSRRWAGFAAGQSAFAPTTYPSVAGLAKHLVKHAGMVGIDTNVWPLGLRELLSG